MMIDVSVVTVYSGVYFDYFLPFSVFFSVFYPPPPFPFQGMADDRCINSLNFFAPAQMRWGIYLPYAIWHLYAMTLSQVSSRPALPLSEQVHNLQSLMLIV